MTKDCASWLLLQHTGHVLDLFGPWFHRSETRFHFLFESGIESTLTKFPRDHCINPKQDSLSRPAHCQIGEDWDMHTPGQPFSPSRRALWEPDYNQCLWGEQGMGTMGILLMVRSQHPPPTHTLQLRYRDGFLALLIGLVLRDHPSTMDPSGRVSMGTAHTCLLNSYFLLGSPLTISFADWHIACLAVSLSLNQLLITTESFVLELSLCRRFCVCSLGHRFWHSSLWGQFHFWRALEWVGRWEAHTSLPSLPRDPSADLLP